MRYVQVNTVPNGSTGTVMRRTAEERRAAGDDCWEMWGRGRSAENDREYNFGSRAGTYADALLTRLDDRAGFHSKGATRRLLAKLDEIDPDVVHLHNLHGYYVNVEMLFGWLASHRCLVRWTLHDCWAFTGHCAHFTYVGCDRWRTGCHDCPQKGTYPASCLMDSSTRNWEDKRRLFTGIPPERMGFIAPSRWLADLVGESFLGEYPLEVRRNSIDREVFKPTPSDFRERYGIGDRFMVLGVASPWTERKGLGVFSKLARALDSKKYAVVLVGLSKKQIKRLSRWIVGIERTESARELSEAYTAADLFVNPSIEETFGMTVAEAVACGTPSVVVRGSACIEAAEGAEHYVVARDLSDLKCVVTHCEELRCNCEKKCL